MSARPDLADFEVGAIYRHDESGGLAEFIGTAWMTELEGEDVGVLRWVAGGGCLIATRISYENGETFTRYGDAIDDELAIPYAPDDPDEL